MSVYGILCLYVWMCDENRSKYPKKWALQLPVDKLQGKLAGKKGDVFVR